MRKTTGCCLRHPEPYHRIQGEQYWCRMSNRLHADLCTSWPLTPARRPGIDLVPLAFRFWLCNLEICFRLAYCGSAHRSASTTPICNLKLLLIGSITGYGWISLRCSLEVESVMREVRCMNVHHLSRYSALSFGKQVLCSQEIVLILGLTIPLSDITQVFTCEAELTNQGWLSSVASFSAITKRLKAPAMYHSKLLAKGLLTQLVLARN